MPLIRKPAPSAERAKPGAAEVLSGLGSANSDDRWAAARAAAEIPDCAAALAAALPQEIDSRVREAMFTSLARIGTRDSIAGMLPMLRSNDAALRTGALDALSSSIVASHELLPQLLRDPDIDVRILSCELARRLPGAEANRVLSELLVRETEVNVCGAAIDVLAEVGDQSALSALARCAQRFSQVSFLTFAIKLATDRIRAADTSG